MLITVRYIDIVYHTIRLNSDPGSISFEISLSPQLI